MRIVLVVMHRGTPNPVIDLNWNAVPRVGDSVMYSGQRLEVVGVEWHVCADWENPPVEPSTWIPFARVIIRMPHAQAEAPDAVLRMDPPPTRSKEEPKL